MASLLPILAIAFAAFCLWLTVRIINRREKWAKQLAMGLGVLTAYPLSFGPACWLTSYLGQGADLRPAIYRPLLAVMRIGEEEKELRFCDAYGWMEGRPERVPNVPNGRLSWFANFGAAPGWHWRYEAIYTIRSGLGDDLRIRLGDQAWEWSDRP